MNKSPLPSVYWLTEPLHPLSIWLKMAVLLLIGFHIQSYPTQPSWAVLMILFAALVLVPIGFQQICLRQNSFETDSEALIWHFPSSLFLAMSFLIDRSNTAGLLAFPYAVWCLEVLFRGLKFEYNSAYISVLFSLAFLSNASLWLLFDRLGYQPLGFSTWIVLLTGVHFHYAGFALLISLSLFLHQYPKDKMVERASQSIILGIIFTAIGITVTQLGLGQEIETFAGVWMAIAAIFAAYIFLKYSLVEQSVTKYLWQIGGGCLFLAMLLACLYAFRSLLSIEFLTIPIMQAIHGSLNALGFGSLMLFGWALKKE